MQRQTTMIKEADIVRNWYVIDAKEKPLGRLASEVAQVLTGKNKATYTPNFDCGDFVIILNAKYVGLSGDKLKNKKYYSHSKYNGGLRTRTAREMIEKFPREMVEKAVWGMLPKGRLGRKIYTKLFVYEEDKHPHAAQKPTVMEVEV